MIKSKTGYGYRDLTIVPDKISRVIHRSDIDCFDTDGKLPIFAAPMSCVIDDSNYEYFEANNIHTIIPRNVSLEKRIKLMSEGYWVAMSLSEFTDIFVHLHKCSFLKELYKSVNVLIDIANGHMSRLYDVCWFAKQWYYDNCCGPNYAQFQIMTGNIANPDTYEYICELNSKANANLHDSARCVDYIRVGIGGGAGCLTTTQTAIHYPQASLINDCASVKSKFNKSECPMIIADGGIRNYSDVIKALGLGADYVMIGGLFGSLLESCAHTYVMQGETFVHDIDVKELLNEPESIKRDKYLDTTYHKIYKTFYGMSTKRAQKEIGKVSRTSEGREYVQECTHTLKQWVENMCAYLQSAMSYCNALKLDEFIGQVDFVVNSNCEINAVNK